MNNNEEFPPCPQCKSTYAYKDRDHYACPECGHQWVLESQVSAEVDILLVKDANGTQLQEGDYVTLIKDLKVKGSSTVAKVGTKVKIIRLLDGDHNIDCRIEGIGPMLLKSEFVKKSSS